MRSVPAQQPSDEIGESAQSLWETALEALPRIGVALAVIVIGWVASRGARVLLRRLLNRRRTPSFASVMSKVFGWALLAVVILVALAVTFPSVRPVDLLAGLGFFSVAIGFAFQDILENTLAGILLLFRQPFRAGDQIEVVGVLGSVVEINIRETRLVTFDGDTVVIPNRDVYKNVIRVRTERSHRRLGFEVGIGYEADADRAIADIVAALAEVPDVAREPAPAAVVSELGESTVTIRVLFWAPSRQQDGIRTLDAAIRAVKASLDADGIELPAQIVVLQAAPSFRAAIHGDADVTPGGGVRPDGPAT
ncbi:MAG: mechanosensitive ion channel family protein [Acidimicrobiia bacterium]